MLIDYYPEVVKRIREIEGICVAEQPEFESISHAVDNAFANMFPTTADEYGIARLEEELGIVSTPGQQLEERRITVSIRTVKKNLSFQKFLDLVKKYSQETDLIPVYTEDELEVAVGDHVKNVRSIYNMLDEILSLNIFIYISHEDILTLGIQEICARLELETSADIFKKANLFHESEGNMETSMKITENFEDVTAACQYNLWYLDGSVKLDGSRMLNAKEIKEEI